MHTATAVFYGFLLCLVAIGVQDIFFIEENRCSMTYMFENPEYQKIKIPRKVANLYPSYELYLYGEGAYAEENKNLTLSGIPILFLPGNAGSYKQVRSLGSIALRKAENIDWEYHFNVFTVNLNEELVAFYGGSLQRQTKFVHECIKIILRLYKGREFAPRSVALVGHSMGGLVARALLTLKNFKPQLINVIVTQATPHVAPVLPTDQYLIDFYEAVNNYWILRAREVRSITLLSVTGGFRDSQVRSGLTFLPRSHHPNSALSVVSSSVPRVWVSTDHLSIVWCKELVLATVRAFFDFIDEDTGQITEDPKKRMSVLRHHFVRHPAKHQGASEETVSALSESSLWIPVKTSTWTYTVYEASNETFYTFPLANHKEVYSHFHCKNNLLFTYSWIYGCTTDKSSDCSQANDLSWETELLPPIKSVTLKLEDYHALTHFVLQVPTTNGSQFTTECEFFNEESRTVQIPVTHVLSFGFTAIKTQLSSMGLVHNVQLKDFSQIYQAFNIYIERRCQVNAGQIPDVYRLHVPWSNEDSVLLASNESVTRIFAKLHSAKPENDSSIVTLNLYTSQECQYEITVKTSFMQVLGQIMRFHGLSLPVYIIASILLAYGGQFSSLTSKGHCLEFDAVLSSSAKPYKVVPIVNIWNYLFRYGWFTVMWDSLFLWTLDSIIQSSQGVWFPLVSLILFFFGISVAYWWGMFFMLSLRCMSFLWIALKRPVQLPEDSRMLTRQRLGVCTVLALIGWTTCGAFALLLVSLHYLFKVIKLYSTIRTFTGDLNVVANNSAENKETSNHSNQDSHEKYDSCSTPSDKVEQLQTNSCEAHKLLPHTACTPSSSAIEDAVDCLKMHITIMNLLTWVLFVNLPSLCFWLKDLWCNLHLDPDPCGLMAPILIYTLEILMNSRVTAIKSSKLVKVAARLPLALSIAIVAFGPMHLYRVSYFVIVSLLVHVLCCFV